MAGQGTTWRTDLFQLRHTPLRLMFAHPGRGNKGNHPGGRPRQAPPHPSAAQQVSEIPTFQRRQLRE
ncbi:putative hypothetical protein [Deinococcus grandis]|uniref:Uncharacterized protein n=1 Tax=Deinococcus grandis TaxID=57498 RepID=A0A117DR62_9DEIO|nr:putative hypothetical protein [Deinococcus grandis]